MVARKAKEWTGAVVIVHLITGLQYGGAEHQLAQLVLNTDKERFRHIVVALRGGGPVASQLASAGIETRSLGMKRGVPSVRGAMRLVRLLRRWQPTVLHCWLYHACLMGAVCGRLAGTRSVLWGLRSANPGLRGYGWRTKAVVRLCARLSRGVDRIIVNSEKNRLVHLELGYAPGKMQVIQNGVDSQRFRPDTEARRAVREELSLPPDGFLVGMLAGYRPAKDHATFLRAARLLREKHADIRFLLAGEGIAADNAALARLLRENDLTQAVHLLGPRSDVERLTAALDIACVSSWSESFPNAVVEAMACGVPCVATNVGDTLRILGDVGIVVPPEIPKALADGCFCLLEMGEQGRKELGYLARKRVETSFSAAKTTHFYENLYQEMLQVLRSQRALVRV